MHNPGRNRTSFGLRWTGLALAAGLVAAVVASPAGAQTVDAAQRPPAAAKPTVVLVHGAWADASSWSSVTENLIRDGYPVTAVPNPLRGVASDASYLRDFLSTVSGPVVLVGHSYGGMVITNAASAGSNVKALVYIDAYIPQSGDTVSGLTSAMPGSMLDPATSITPVPLHDQGGNVIGADLYIKQSAFPALFANGIPARQAAVLAAGQRPLIFSALDEPSVSEAWRSIPSWVLIGTQDRVIPPAQQRFMAERAGATVVSVKAPHLSMVSDPRAVTTIIEAAAKA